MAVYAELFDGTRLEFPDGTDPSVINATAKKVTQSLVSDTGQPPAELPTETPIASQKPEDVGFIERNIGAAKRGVESLGDVAGGLGLAGTALTGTEAETAAKMREIKREQAKPQETPGLTAGDIERIYKQKGLGAAAAQVPSYITESILASAPQMAVPLAAGAAATPFLSPVGGALVGMGAYGVQQFGNFLTRQAQEKNDPKELEILKAAGTAAATAPLGYFADRFTAGLGGMGAKKAGTEILKELSARQVAAKVGKRVAVGATEGIIAEAPVEVLEQAAERYQAGLSLTGDDAANEYKEAFFGAAAAGAGIGGASRGIEAYQKPVKPGAPVVPPVTPPEEQTKSAVPPMVAPPSGSQDTQAMIDELKGTPPAAPVATPPVVPPSTPPISAVTPQVTPEPLGNVWESIQNRDRSTPASVAQMAKIANEPDYSRVSVSRDYGTGAPIVAGADVNPAQLGRQDTVTGADGKKVPVQYAVIEANEVIPSHNADGTKNPSYVDPSVPAFRAITNGRVAGLQAAYNQGTAQDYKASLINDDLTGIDKKVIEGMKNPMLVRVMPMDAVNQNTGDISNTGAGLSFNIVEQAKNDTNRLDLSTVQFGDNGDVSQQTIKDFIKAMPTTEQGNLMDKQGNPTKQAVERVDAAIFQQAYGNDKLTELAFQSQDEEARNIVRALNMAASKAIQLTDAGDYDVRPLVNEAVELAINARRNNLSLQDAAKQVDMTANPLANDILQMFADNPRSAKAIGENLSNLFDNAYNEGSKEGADMFGAVPKRPVDQIIKESFAKKIEPDLFAQPTEKPTTTPSEKPVEQPVQAVSPEPKEFKIKKSMEEIAAEIGKMSKGSQVSQWLIDNAPNSAAKAIAEKINNNIKAIEKSGVPIEIEVLNGRKRSTYYGYASYVAKKGAISHFAVKYNGLNSQGKAESYPPADKPTGTRYSTIMHELLHVISMVQLSTLVKRNFKGPEKVIHNDLRAIYRAVEQKVEEERKLPKEKRHPAVSRSSLWLKNVDELFVRSLTESDLQDFLSTINMGKKTALTKLMEIFRKVIGLDPQYQSALDKIMTVSDKIFAQTPQDIERLAKHRGYTFITMKEEAVPEETAVKEKPVAAARNYLGQPVKPTWQFPEDTFIHVPGVTDISVNDLIYKFQDKQIDTKRAQEAISKAAGQITDDINVYQKEQLFHGRVATAIREYLLNELLPAIKKLKELNLKPQEMQDYLLARHAEERNNKMNELNKLDPRTGEERTTPWELQDRASGMSTADARALLKGLDPAKREKLETVAKMFDDMVTGTQKILVDSGADSQDTIDAWNETYKHYVPLFRIEENFINGMGASGLSKGFNVSGGFSKRAMGSEKEVQDIIANLIKQRERALIRAEKLTVTKALYGLFLMNPNPDVALPVNPDAIKSKDALIKELEGLGYDNAEEIANNLMEEPKSRYISKEKRVIDKNTGLPTTDTPESVKLKVNNLDRFGDNVITLRIDGKNRYIFFNQKNPDALRMANSLKSLDVESLGTLTSLVSKATRWFASVNTQYNPIFAAVNLIRDVGGAQFNLTTTPLAGKQAQVTAGIFPAMKGIFNVLRAERKGEVGGDSDMEKAFRDFRKEGGQTGYRDSLARKENEKSIVDEQLAKITAGGNAKKAFKAVFGALSDFNDTLENAIRLSAYLAASKPKDKGGLGLSKQQSAIIAKNLTVNFDKKGQLSANINALYAFFNASIQGSARLAQTLKGPKGKAIMGGGVLLGSMQALLLAAAGFKDDEPPEFVKERNFIIPTPDGNYLSIPYPLGLHILPSVGRLTTEFMINGFKNPTKKVGDLIGVFADGLSPVGSAGALQTIAPTVLDPLAALKENKDAFGRPIYKKEQATNPTPGYMRSRESSSEISKQISYFLNMASGGGKYSKGLVSPTADEIDYVVGQVTGGVGRELMKAGQTLKAASTGEDLPAYRVPLAGRFYGETQSNAAESQRFYNNIIKMADHENEIKGRIKNKEPVGPYMKDHPEARLWQMANTTENQINALNKQKKEFIEKDLPKERIKRIENQKATIMKRFNDHLAKIEK